MPPATGSCSYVNSGWRSAAYQEQLLDEAVSTYGSRKEAARWVATPDTSAHVSGDAVDIGPTDAAAWLSDHGAGYGLCQIYRNEPWHYELRPERRRPRVPGPVRRPLARPADAAAPVTLIAQRRRRGRRRRTRPGLPAGGCARRRPRWSGARTGRRTSPRRLGSGWGAPLASPSSVMVGTVMTGPSASRFSSSSYRASPSASPSRQR